MKNKINKIAKDTNVFLKSFIKKQLKTNLITPMRYGLFPGGKKIRAKILIDTGFLFKFNLLLLKISNERASKEFPANTAVASSNFICIEGFPLLI